MRLHVFTPVFTGETSDPDEISRRYRRWIDWLQTRRHTRLRSICNEGVIIDAYGPGTEIAIPDENDPNAVRLSLPQNNMARVSKGVLARLHLLKTLAQAEANKWALSENVFACIDGSGAFDYDSLESLATPFKKLPAVEIVLGRRPPDCCGMSRGRKELEQFEQFLLFLYRRKEIGLAFANLELDSSLLPDGQAGCWAFRLTAASRLPLTAMDYIEFDVLASAIESKLPIVYTEPLKMNARARHSSVSADPIGWSIGKIAFIQQKLRLTKRQIAVAWHDFNLHFAGSALVRGIPLAYEPALRNFCGAAWTSVAGVKPRSARRHDTAR